MKSSKRNKQRAESKARKAAGMSGGGTSKYAQKKHEQRNGHYRPSSPFYDPSAR
jgi:hypothetical protein